MRKMQNIKDEKMKILLSVICSLTTFSALAMNEEVENEEPRQMEVQNQPDPEELRLRALELGLPEEADQEAIENEEL
jgi:preprotein translocase subunit SecF